MLWNLKVHVGTKIKDHLFPQWIWKTNKNNDSKNNKIIDTRDKRPLWSHLIYPLLTQALEHTCPLQFNIIPDLYLLLLRRYFLCSPHHFEESNLNSWLADLPGFSLVHNIPLRWRSFPFPVPWPHYVLEISSLQNSLLTYDTPVELGHDLVTLLSCFNPSP